ncbi:MAG: KEOPS complex subunit Cgi121 [Candidatus Bathyarchaeia archaeon]
MLKYIEEFGKYVLITGFRNAKTLNFEELFGVVRKELPKSVEVQIFDARFVATWQHLYFAVLNALTAFKNKGNISKTLAMESMLYASAQRQIRKAMKSLGIKPQTSEIAVVMVGEKPEILDSALSTVSAHIKAPLDEVVLELSNEKVKSVQEVFGISDVEIEAIMGKDGLEEALTNLVIERMALLSTQR